MRRSHKSESAMVIVLMMEKSARRIVPVLLIQFLLATETRAQSIADIAERVGKSVTMIVTYDATGSVIGQGSGVFINKNGLVLTNAHVLEDAYSAEVISDLGTFDRITIVFRDPTRDLALIQLKTNQASPISFASDPNFRPGDRVVAIGNPLGLEKTVSDGLISGIRLTNDGVELIQTTVPISPGSSGGVLLNTSGELIGITSSTLEAGQNINFAISLRTILDFLSDYENQLATATPEQLKPARESVWYRVLLKWVGAIILFLIAIIFSGTFYYIIPLLILVCYIVYWCLRGLWLLLTYPLRKAKEYKAARYKRLTDKS
jgi:S1-C subfamily serine protease